MRFVESLNTVHLNVWAMVILIGGIVLMCCHHAPEGGMLVTGSFALLRSVEPAKKEVVNAPSA